MFSYKVRKFLIRLTTKNLNRTVRPAKYKKYIDLGKNLTVFQEFYSSLPW